MIFEFERSAGDLFACQPLSESPCLIVERELPFLGEARAPWRSGFLLLPVRGAFFLIWFWFWNARARGSDK